MESQSQTYFVSMAGFSWGVFDPPNVLIQGGSLEAFTTAVPAALQDQAATTPPAAGFTPSPMTAAQHQQPL